MQIDLRQHAALWEEFQDVLVAESRRGEESAPLDKVKAKLAMSGKLGA